MSHDPIEAGLRELRAGRLAEAKALYEQVLASEPRHADALHLLGVVALQSGQPARAAQLIEQALEVQPQHPGYRANLAQAYFAAGRIADAHAAFLHALELKPGEPQFALGAANCLAMQGRHAEAEQALRQLLRAHPAFPLAWYNLGNALRDQGRHEEAADCFRRTVSLDPASADAHNNLGGALQALARFEEAERAYRQSIELRPESIVAYRNLAGVLIDAGRFAEAAAVCEQQIARFPDVAELHFQLGSAFVHQGRLDRALGALRNAVRLAPDYARAAGALGSTLHHTGHPEEARHWLECALALEPESTDFHHAMAGILLSAGELRGGWAEYGARPARQHYLAKSSGVSPPRELPRDLSGSSICLLREQGLGDEIFFLRFAPALKSRGPEIAYWGSSKLASLFQRVPVLQRVAAHSEPVPDADITMLVGDLPHALGALESRPVASGAFPHEDSREFAIPPHQGLPGFVRVLFPEVPPPLPLTPIPERLALAKQELARLGPPPYVGITWRAGTLPEKQQGTDWFLHKHAPLQQLGTTLRQAKGTYLALQYNPKPGEIEMLASCIGRPVHDLTAANDDLEAMLALLAIIDDYIGVSNTNMHLRAGAGRTARVLVQVPADWRWMAAGDESPWFPGFRIYRQGPDGDWSPALDRLGGDLRVKFGP